MINTLFHPHIKKKKIAPAQIRAARGMLDWTRSNLARKASLSVETIKNIEHGTYSPKEETIKAITNAFAKQGVEFVCSEAITPIPAEGKASGLAMTISYSSITCIEISVTETQEAPEQ